MNHYISIIICLSCSNMFKNIFFYTLFPKYLDSLLKEDKLFPLTSSKIILN